MLEIDDPMDVRKVAKLAHLEITDEEVAMYTPQMANIVKYVEQLNELARRNETVWLIYTMPFEIQAFSPELWKTIQNDYETVRSFPGTLNGGDVVVCVYRKKPEKQ